MLSEMTSGIITDVLEEISEQSVPSEEDFMDEDKRIRRKLGRIDSRTFLDKILREASDHQKISPKDHRRSVLRESYYYGRRRMRHLSRHSTIRNTAVSLMSFRKKFFIFDRADMCLCGLLSLDLSVHLICCVEVFFSMVLLIQAPDLLTSDGTYFYFLGAFEGCGVYFFALHLIMCVSCVCSALLLYIGGKMKRPGLVLAHLIWQLFFICMTITLSTVLLSLGMKGVMLLSSSIVLSIMLITPGLAELWWSYLTYCFYRQLKRRQRKKKLTASSSDCLEIPQTEC